MEDLKRRHNIEKYTFVSSSIGYNDEVYFLFSEHVPERINGMFVNSRANTGYKVVHGLVDWPSEKLLYEECFDLGVHEMNFHFVQPIRQDILLLGARAGLRDGIYEKNASIVNEKGKVLNTIFLGDGIEDCIVTTDGRIITSYFDEGVFGDFPLGNKGLIVWDSAGQPIWKNEHYAIYDCYAMNIDEQENLWFYYYDEFNLVRTDFQRDLVYHPEINGITKFLLTKGNQLMCDGGYNKHGQFYKMDILYDRLENMETVNLEHEGSNILLQDSVFRSSKAIFTDNRNHLYFKDVIYL